jgi:hypothetical protein
LGSNRPGCDSAGVSPASWASMPGSNIVIRQKMTGILTRQT